MVYNGRLFSFLQISSWNLPKWRYINSPFVAFIQIFNYNNFALFLPGRPFLFVKGILSLFISLKLTVPEDKDYFSSGNTRLRRSSAKWRTAGTYLSQGEIHVPSSLSPPPQARIHASRRVQVHDRRESGGNRAHTEEEPRLWESNATPWDPPASWTAVLPKLLCIL